MAKQASSVSSAASSVASSMSASASSASSAASVAASKSSSSAASLANKASASVSSASASASARAAGKSPVLATTSTTAMTTTAIVITAIIAALAAAHFSGALDPVYKFVMEKFFKAEAKAELVALEKTGSKQAEDMLKERLKKNPVANLGEGELDDVAKGAGLGDKLGKINEGGLGKLGL